MLLDGERERMRGCYGGGKVEKEKVEGSLRRYLQAGGLLLSPCLSQSCLRRVFANPN